VDKPIAAWPMMRGLIGVLVLPVAAGQLLRAPAPLRQLSTRYKSVLSVVARLLTVAIMFKAGVEVRDRLGNDAAPGLGSLVLVAGVCLTIHLVALASGLWSSKALGFDRPSQIAVAIAGSQKTLPVSLILFEEHFRNYALAVFPLVFYHFGQLIVDTFIADRLAGRPPPGEELPTEEVL
jgi:sodium/bile acid cotransporter 7